MLAYFCKTCKMYFRLAELLESRHCPECRGLVVPRLILGGQVMGHSEEDTNA